MFTHADPKNAKRKSSHLCLFALLRSASVKADCKIGEIEPKSKFLQHFAPEFFKESASFMHVLKM